MEAQRSLKPLVARSTRASGTDPVSVNGRPEVFDTSHGGSIPSTGTAATGRWLDGKPPGSGPGTCGFDSRRSDRVNGSVDSQQVSRSQPAQGPYLYLATPSSTVVVQPPDERSMRVRFSTRGPWTKPNGLAAGCEPVTSGFDSRRPPQQRVAQWKSAWPGTRRLRVRFPLR